MYNNLTSLFYEKKLLPKNGFMYKDRRTFSTRKSESVYSKKININIKNLLKLNKIEFVKIIIDF